MTTYGPKNLRISFTAEGLTHFGGLVLVQRFLQRLGLRRALTTYVRFPQRNHHYSIAEHVLAVLYPLILGLGRIETTEPLRRNGVFQYLSGLPTYPAATTLRRFLYRFGRAGRWGRPDQRKLGQYLLSNLVVCRECGGHISVVGGAPRVYGCREYFSRATCNNHLTQRVAVVDAAFLACLQREVLTREGFGYAVACGVERVRERLAQEPERVHTLEQEKATLVRRCERLAAAIGDGQGPAALVREINKAEARIQEIEVELARLAAAPSLTALDPGMLEEAVAAQLARFQDLIMSNVAVARQALKKLLLKPMVFTPVEAESGRLTYAFEGELSFGPVIHEIIISEKKPRNGPQMEQWITSPTGRSWKITLTAGG